MRDRLIELLKKKILTIEMEDSDSIWYTEKMDELADHLLANGVIVQANGYWIEQSDGWDGVLYTCSACRCDWCTIDGTPIENNMRYCPECGARMDEPMERRSNDEQED